MDRSPGWTKLAEPAFELAALAFAVFAMSVAAGTQGKSVRDPAAKREAEPVVKESVVAEAPAQHAHTEVSTGVAPPPASPAREDPWNMRPREFLTEIQDEGANYYRASDATIELLAGVYSDGRIRLADARGRRFAGALIGGHADLLELQKNDWSEVFLRVTPTGRMQLELRGGPYDAHVLTCEQLRP